MSVVFRRHHAQQKAVRAARAAEQAAYDQSFVDAEAAERTRASAAAARETSAARESAPPAPTDAAKPAAGRTTGKR